MTIKELVAQATSQKKIDKMHDYLRAWNMGMLYVMTRLGHDATPAIDFADWYNENKEILH